MSRIGKIIRTIPTGVTIDVKGRELIIKGPKGELHQEIHPNVTVVAKDGEVSVTVRHPEDKKERALWGTYSSLIKNMLGGVTEGYKKELEISGVGFKVAMQGVDLLLEVGFSHPVVVKALPGTKFSVDKSVITVEGIDKQMVGEMAAQVRAVRKPEPYKGKGIKYVGEVIRRKAGKTAAKAAK